MPFLNLILWLIIGGLAGYFAGRFMGAKRPFGMIGDIGLGILGSMAGGFLLGLLGFEGSGLIPSLVTAFIGATALIWLLRKFK